MIHARAALEIIGYHIDATVTQPEALDELNGALRDLGANFTDWEQRLAALEQGANPMTVTPNTAVITDVLVSEGALARSVLSQRIDILCVAIQGALDLLGNDTYNPGAVMDLLIDGRSKSALLHAQHPVYRTVDTIASHPDDAVTPSDAYDGFGLHGEPDSIIRNGTDRTLFEHDPTCDCERCRPGDPGDYEEAN